jgi:hypothetical protein
MAYLGQDVPAPGVVDKFRQFVDDERGKLDAKKQSMVKTERDKVLADLKQFQSSFKVGVHATL